MHRANGVRRAIRRLTAPGGRPSACRPAAASHTRSTPGGTPARPDWGVRRSSPDPGSSAYRSPACSRRTSALACRPIQSRAAVTVITEPCMVTGADQGLTPVAPHAVAVRTNAAACALTSCIGPPSFCGSSSRARTCEVRGNAASGLPATSTPAGLDRFPPATRVVTVGVRISPGATPESPAARAGTGDRPRAKRAQTVAAGECSNVANPIARHKAVGREELSCALVPGCPRPPHARLMGHPP
jgi:hypothetical protein